ncbi:unnamed protein product [Parajaminaea phylloscopi]
MRDQCADPPRAFANEPGRIRPLAQALQDGWVRGQLALSAWASTGEIHRGYALITAPGLEWTDSSSRICRRRR